MQAEVLKERNSTPGDDNSTYDEGMYVDETYNKFPLREVPEGNNPASKPLSFILEQAINYTHEELMVLLQKSPVPIVEMLKYAHSTRCKFVKLYALVKWLKSWQKFDQLNKINYFLDDISAQFTESGDALMEMTRLELPLLALSKLDVNCALDVLIYHHFSRTPMAIWNRHIEDKISRHNKHATLWRLGDLLTNALIHWSPSMNAWINQLTIEDGTLIMSVENEFTVRVIRQEDEEGERWQILTIKILVHDYVTAIGHDMVHPQHNMEGLSAFVQTEMNRNRREAFNTMYDILHTFCLKLQLDILYIRLKMAVRNTPTFVKIKDYDMKQGYLVYYVWPESSQQYLVKVNADKRARFLKIRHYPHYHNLPDLDIVDGFPKVNQFLLETAYHRVTIRIKQIKVLLANLAIPKGLLQRIGDMRIMVLYRIMPFQNVPRCEDLHITVNVLTGKIQCQIGTLLEQEDGQALVEELAQLLDDVLDDQHRTGMYNITKLLARIRLKIYKEKHLEAFQGPHTHLLSKDAYMASVWDIPNLPEEKLLFNFHQDNNFYFLVTFDYDELGDFFTTFYLIERSQHRRNIVELIYSPELWESTIPQLQFVGFKGYRRPRRNLLGHPKTTSWVVRRRQLRSFMSAVDGKVQMAQIKEAIKQLGLPFEADTEPAVGGNVISITDFSRPINFDAVGFEDHIQQVCLRMHRHGIFHLEVCIKDPPVLTKELQKNGVFRFVAAIHHATIPPNTSYFENLKRNLFDHLITYAKLFKAVKEFAVAYETRLHKYVDVVFYNYYKLIINYSKHRNLALVVSWKNNYEQLIANFGQVNTTIDGKVVIAEDWNPHVLVCPLLMERLKENEDLAGLVEYLINTERSLNLIYYFAQMHLTSKRALEQLLCLEHGPFTPLVLTNILIPISEFQIRLVHGFAHVEFFLLSNNRVAVRANQVKSEDEYLEENGPVMRKLPGFSHFWSQFSVGTKIETFEARERQDLPKSSTNPSSVPPQEVADSELGNYPMSCPPKYDERFEEFVEYAEKQERDDLNKVFVIDPDVFEKAMSIPGEKSEGPKNRRHTKVEPLMPAPISPFEAYLSGINYIARLPRSLQAFSLSMNPIQQLPIHDLKADDWSVSFELAGVQASTTAYPAWTTKFRIFLCPKKFSVSIKIEFIGANAPSETDIKVFVKFFETVVVSLDNDYALHSFFSMCRINVSGVFSSFARLMSAQMDPFSQSLNYFWAINLQLINIRPPKSRRLPNGQEEVLGQPEFVSGILINASKADVLITIGLRPSKPSKSYKHIKIAFFYNIDNESIRYQPSGPADENTMKIESALSTMSKEPHEQCIIWPSIRHIIERFR